MVDALFWTDILTFAADTSHRIGAELTEKFGKLTAVRKADGSLVTEADQWSDREICQAIATAFPDHGILSEEKTHILPGNDWCWVIDPLTAQRILRGAFRSGAFPWGYSTKAPLFLVMCISLGCANPSMAIGTETPV